MLSILHPCAKLKTPPRATQSNHIRCPSLYEGQRVEDGPKTGSFVAGQWHTSPLLLPKVDTIPLQGHRRRAGWPPSPVGLEYTPPSRHLTTQYLVATLGDPDDMIEKFPIGDKKNAMVCQSS